VCSTWCSTRDGPVIIASMGTNCGSVMDCPVIIASMAGGLNVVVCSAMDGSVIIAIPIVAVCSVMDGSVINIATNCGSACAVQWMVQLLAIASSYMGTKCGRVQCNEWSSYYSCCQLAT